MKTRNDVFSNRWRRVNNSSITLTALLLAILTLATVTLDESEATSDMYGNDLTWDLDNNDVLLREPTVQVGDIVESGVLRYKVTALQPSEVCLIGCESILKTLNVPEFVEFHDMTFSVTAIGKQAFYGCDTIVSADLGNVSEIGVKAFANCTKLKIADVGESLKTISSYAFYRCVRLTDINIEDSAETIRAIGSYAFYKCDKLSSIAVPSYVTTIGDEKPFPAGMTDEHGNLLELTPDELRGYVYEKMDGRYVRQIVCKLEDEHDGGKLNYKVIATLPAKLEVSSHSGTFRNITIPETIEFDGVSFKVTSIGYRAFYGYEKLRTVSMPGIEKIGKEAFYGCTYVKPADMSAVKSIGVKAFAKCSSMGPIELGGTLKTINAYAFYACKSLGSVDIPDSVTSIGSYAFYKCSGLEDIHLSSSLKKIGSCAFAYTTLEKIEIPARVTSIGSYAFYSCFALKTIDIEGFSVAIKASAFASCPALGHVSMPDTVKMLGSGAFEGIVFKDAEGKTLEHTANNLSGMTFEGSGGILHILPAVVKVIFLADGCRISEDISFVLPSGGDFTYHLQKHDGYPECFNGYLPRCTTQTITVETGEEGLIVFDFDRVADLHVLDIRDIYLEYETLFIAGWTGTTIEFNDIECINVRCLDSNFTVVQISFVSIDEDAIDLGFHDSAVRFDMVFLDGSSAYLVPNCVAGLWIESSA